ncbi:MAG: HAMP domain-containing histidine kinase, partial [Erysipelotrichaceae bacterium]|nr:HAMP domain-containing histidine kinase [Erysipelotrichaceae bacterium]
PIISSMIGWCACLAWMLVMWLYLKKEENREMFRFVGLIPFELRAVIVLLGIIYTFNYIDSYNAFYYNTAEYYINSWMFSTGIIHVIYSIILLLGFTLFVYWVREIGQKGFFRGLFGRSVLLTFLFKGKDGAKVIYYEIREWFIGLVSVKEYNTDTKETVYFLVFLNCIFLLLLSELLGLFGILIYSCCLFVGADYVIHHANMNYQTVIRDTNKLASGDLTAPLADSYGLFEPIRLELQKIQGGFQKAVTEAVKSERMKTELISNVSHDLKTPLTTMISYQDLLAKEEDAEKRKEYLQILSRSTNRLKILIEDLFEVSKASSGSVKMEWMDVDVVALVDQTLFELLPQFEEKGLTVKKHYDIDSRILTLDSEKTYRIFQNIFTNACKYSLPGSRVHVYATEENDMTVFRITNVTEKEVLGDPNDLTERMKRGDASRHSEGSGLGLAIAKSFMQLQNGSMNIRVEEDIFKVECYFTQTKRDE